MFESFAACGSVNGVLSILAQEGRELPRRVRTGSRRDEVRWSRPNTASLYAMLRCPVYAGAFAWGRKRGPDSSSGRPYILKDKHPAYISWSVYEMNLRQMASNRHPARGLECGLLTGRIYCGICGLSMIAHYGGNGGTLRYSCRGERDYGGDVCQGFSAPVVDKLISARIQEALSPASVEIAVRAVDEVEATRLRQNEYWNQARGRAAANADRAYRQLNLVEPNNRLVASNLEARYEAALKEQRRVEEKFERFRAEVPPQLSDCERQRVRAAAGISTLWTVLSAKEQAEIVRLMIERVTARVVDDSERLEVGILWHGGSQSQFEARRPVRHFWQLSDYAELRDRALELLGQGMGKAYVAATLNAEGKKPARSNQFTVASVDALLSPGNKAPKKPHPEPTDRKPGEWLIDELSAHLAVPKSTIYNWVSSGRLSARRESNPHNKTFPRWLICADKSELKAIIRWHNENKLRGRKKVRLATEPLAGK